MTQAEYRKVQELIDQIDSQVEALKRQKEQAIEQFCQAHARFKLKDKVWYQAHQGGKEIPCVVQGYRLWLHEIRYALQIEKKNGELGERWFGDDRFGLPEKDRYHKSTHTYIRTRE